MLKTKKCLKCGKLMEKAEKKIQWSGEGYAKPHPFFKCKCCGYISF